MRNGLVSAGVAAGLLLASACGGNGDDPPPRASSASTAPAEGAERRPDPRPADETIELTDWEGFRYRTPLPILGSGPQARKEAAPPGKVFLHVDLTLENLQRDRTAEPSKLVEELVFAADPGSGAGRAVCEQPPGPGCIYAWPVCEHRDRTFEGDPEELDDSGEPMPAGTTYKLRCYLREPVPASVDPKRIHIFQFRYDAPDRSKPRHIEIPHT
ncbi:hypothetical protein [Embleya sp. MST-111070]|uniref:hypothetical protein n=1 Tax=Embleya sp. MST-111070 TaxID=3398231 RepID=UPI003F737E78